MKRKRERSHRPASASATANQAATPGPTQGSARRGSSLVAFELARQMQRKRFRRGKHRRATAQPTVRARQAKAVSPAQRRGARAEQQALAMLEQAGLQLVARNIQFRSGEIDLVMCDGQVLVFVEVRSRQRSSFGSALESIGGVKQHRIVRAAQYFLHTAWPGPHPRCRFDVVAYDGSTCTWVRDAIRTA